MPLDSQGDLIVKAWELAHRHIAAFGETGLKIRLLSISITSAIISYSYVNTSSALCILIVPLLASFAFLDAIYKSYQLAAAKRCKELEICLNEFLMQVPHPRYPDDGVMTGVPVVSLSGVLYMFHRKYITFWFPYLVQLLALISIALLR
jgi:hypothetical protein